MPDLLKDVIQIGGSALQAEDELLLASGRRHDRSGGLLRVELERYYQFIVWKSLLASYDAQIERPREGGYPIDLIVDEHLFEMKYWHEESSLRVNSDIRRLRSFSRGGNLLIFSANPDGDTDAAIRYLIKESPCPKIDEPIDVFRFKTESPVITRTLFEFWFAGWRIPPERANA